LAAEEKGEEEPALVSNILARGGKTGIEERTGEASGKAYEAEGGREKHRLNRAINF